jgi:16S rRNA A1518/A1519 N6-dimethyltransferase RsmA/KsgA/DIM1 with predicted DNA glycosylase/AP lyase activity
MLKNNLANGLHISNQEAEKMLISTGLDLKIRAEDLAINDWIKLLSIFSANQN